MLMPQKEMYTFSEVAERWKISEKTIIDYLLTDRLVASFFLTTRIVGKYTPVFSSELPYLDDPYVYDIEIDDPDCYRHESGMFNLRYQDITWDEQGQTTLNKGYDLGLTLPDEEEGYYGLIDPHVLKREDVFIAMTEIKRFEADHGIVPHIQSVKEDAPNKIATTSPDSVSKLHPKEKVSLLKMVIVLAVEAYRYNPDDKKSTVTSEIAESAQRMDIPIDEDTVRKWLKEAAALLPNNAPL